MKTYRRDDQRSLAAYAARCADRVLLYFAKANPRDGRPRDAIGVCRKWIRTGVFRMAEIRGASLAAHAAARESRENPAARFAARSAGQAAATAHVAQHAFGAAYYALKAVAAAKPELDEAGLRKERALQLRLLPQHLRTEALRRVVIRKRGRRIAIGIDKRADF